MNTISPRLTLAVRDRELLQALVQKVRLFSLRQIAGHWWEDELANARRRLRRLTTAGLVARLTVQARPLPCLQRPIVTWKPGEELPAFGKIAHQCQSRWRGRPVLSCTALIATRHAARLFGGKSRGALKHPTQATHDLGIAAVWLRFQEQAAAWADAWRGEDLLAHTRVGEKLPDAFLLNAAGEIAWVIEFGGSYDTERFSEFHEDCAQRYLPYQIW